MRKFLDKLNTIISKTIIIGGVAIGIYAVVYIANGFNPIDNQIKISKEYQADLSKANDKLRIEKTELEKKVKPMQERINKIDWRINDNKKLWEIEKAKQEVLGLIKE